MLSTDQSTNIGLKTNLESTSEIPSRMKFNPDVESKDFTHKQVQAIKSISTKSNLIDNNENFDSTDLTI